MITWNYRVFRESDGDYSIREVFYAEDGSAIGCTEKAVEPYGQSLEELTRSISDFQAALSLPVLTLADIPQQATTPRQPQRSGTVSSEELRAELGLGDTSNPSNGTPDELHQKAS